MVAVLAILAAAVLTGGMVWMLSRLVAGDGLALVWYATGGFERAGEVVAFLIRAAAESFTGNGD